jgi:putative hydrolase of HD superfamily
VPLWRWVRPRGRVGGRTLPRPPTLHTPDTDSRVSSPAIADSTARLRRQLALIIEADRLKLVLRRTLLANASRHENSAEHSWHLALAAMTLQEHAEPEVDVARVLRMVVVHDIVEIDAGDTFAYDASANLGRVEREKIAADRLFGVLPAEQGSELRALWDEFEEGRTATARFAIALDRLLPLLLNDAADGGSWRAHGVTRAQVLRRMAPIEDAIPALWPLVLEIVDRNCALGRISAD